MLYVLLKALLLVCIKYPAQGESRVVNITQKPSAIFVARLSLRAVYFHTIKMAVL